MVSDDSETSVYSDQICRLAENDVCQGRLPQAEYICSYQKSQGKDFTQIRESDLGPNNAFCTLYNINFWMDFGARNDVSRHVSLVKLNAVGFSSDNCSLMKGEKNSVVSRINYRKIL